MQLGTHSPLATLLAFLFLASSPAAPALGPHEVLLLVNGNSPRSKQVANYYVRLRQIPPQNVVTLDLPDSFLETYAEVTSADFSRFIWEPANKAVEERGIGDHILAWAYSADFPVRIAVEPKMSVQGITFTRNTVPDADLINKGQYLSDLFAGPDQAGGNQAPSHTLDGFKGRFRENMPLPSMMLGLTGARGMDVEAVLKCLSRGALSDRTAPHGTVFFVVNSDVRSKCRDWLYPAVRQELEGLNVASIITSNFPTGRTGVLGVMTGSEWVDPGSVGSYAAGCMADHLTSYSGILDTHVQSKLTEWLQAGATASAGPVTEPFAIWTKFPNARFFPHYASGCTMIESFYQSVRCPLQLMLVGDPLACPWAPKLSMVLVQTDDGSNPDEAAFSAAMFPMNPVPDPLYMYLLDGRLVEQSPGNSIRISTAKLEDGYHELRSVAYLQGGTVRGQVFAKAGFTVNRMGRQVQFDGLKNKTAIDLCRPFQVAVSARGAPEKLTVLQNGRALAERSATDTASLEIDPSVMGPGSVVLQAAAVYPDNMTVRGEPVEIEVSRLNHAPDVKGFLVQTNAQGNAAITVEASDAESDPVRLDWFQMARGAGDVPRCLPGSGADIAWTTNGLVFTPAANEFHTATLPDFSLAGVTEVFARISVSPQVPVLKEQKAGFVFDYQDGLNFRYAGLWGERSAWVVGTCADGKMKYEVTRGLPIKADHEYMVSLRAAGDGMLELWVDEELVVRAKGSLGSGALGLMAGGAPARFGDLAISPPLPDSAAAQAALLVPGRGTAFLVRASDGHRGTWATVPCMDRP